MSGSLLPEWLLVTAAIWFFACACFYLYRLLFAESVKAAYGYWDKENEIGHGLCMLGMVTMLSPALLAVPNMIWTLVMIAGCCWFLARAVSWGRRVSYKSKWWWDWAHAIMFGGMALMFGNVSSLWFAVPLGCFWLWFACYYLYELVHDSRSGQWLYIGSDLAHMSMGAMMLLMTCAPSLFMNHMGM